MNCKKIIISVLCVLCFITAANAQRVTDKLDRALVAIPAGTGGGSGIGNFVSWRIFGEEYYDVTYNLYADGVKIAEGLRVSNYTHSSGKNSTKYQVSAVVRGVEQEKSAESAVWVDGYLDIMGATVINRAGADRTDVYEFNDVSLGDVTGNGISEFLAKRNNRSGNLLSSDNKSDFNRYECYSLDGTLMWWIDLGPNLNSGPDEQWDCVLFDWDQDGRCEALMRGADNMIIHTATCKTINVGNMNFYSSRTEYTYEGAEYLLYMDGATGEPFDLSAKGKYNQEDDSYSYTPMDYPLPRGDVHDWGDGYGHRATKHYFGAPFIDGRNPYIFVGRGCYTKHHFKTFRVDPATHQLTLNWEWRGEQWPYEGQGYHNFGIADVDWDGRDEIVFGSMVIDDNGKGLSTTGLGHGDAQHCRDFDPYRHGQEIFACNESNPYGCNYRNATTSKMYLRKTAGGDDGRCLAGNFSNHFPGSMGRSTTTGMLSFTSDRDITSGAPATESMNDALYWAHLNFRIFWDGDLCDEVLDSPGTEREAAIYKPHGGRIFMTEHCKMNNSSKNNPGAMGDIFGDWREEIVVSAIGRTRLRIHTTGIPTTYRIPTLWHDHQYRNAMVWQPCGYNQPPHVSYFLGEMENITIAPPPFTMTDRTEISNDGTISSANNDQHVIVCETNNTNINIAEGASPWIATFNIPSWVQGTNSTVTDGTAHIIYDYYTCTATGGGFSGHTRLVKQGDGTLILPSVAMNHTGNTDIWDGKLQFDGTMLQSPLWLNRFAELYSTGTFRSIRADYASVIHPGGDDVLGTITTDSLMLGFGSRIKLDLFSDGIQADQIHAKYISIETKTEDVWVTYGPKYLMPVIEANIHAGADNLQAPGRYLIGKAETIEGELSDIKVEGIQNRKIYFENEGGNIYLVIEEVRDAGLIYWRGNENYTWDYASTENFVNSEGEKDLFVDHDKVIFDDSATKFTVSLKGDLEADTVIVDNTKAYTFNGTGTLTGGTSIVKRGTGTLTISGENTYTGATIISGGTVKVSQLSTETKAYGNLGAVKTETGKYIIENGATLQATAGVELASPLTIRTDEGGVINNSDGFTASKAVTGTLLTKKGSGWMTLSQSSLKKIIVQAGTVSFNANPATEIEVQGGTIYDYGQATSHGIVVPKGKQATWYLTDTYYTAYNNKVTGEGVLTIIPRNTVSRVRISGDWSQFEGTIRYNTTGITLPLDNSKGLPKGTLNIAADCNVSNTVQSFTIGQLTGSGNLQEPANDFRSSNRLTGNNTWNVGNSDGNNFTFAGMFMDAGGTNKCIFNKIGTCKMTVSGKSYHSGATTVKEGELHFTSGATIGTGTLTVSKNAILSGATSSSVPLTNSGYTINGTLQIGSTAAATTGSIDLGNKSITFNSGSTLQIGVSRCATATNNGCTSLKGIRRLIMNGTIEMHYASSYSPEVGDSIILWESSTFSGTPVLSDYVVDADRGLYWDTTDIAQGILRITDQVPTSIDSFTSTIDESISAIYDLSGRKVSDGTKEDMQSLPRGIYIRNGKKFFIK